MRIAFLGYGNVGGALASAVAAAGHEVVLVEKPGDPGAARDAVARLGLPATASAAPAAEAVTDADVVIVAVPFGALDALLPPLAGALSGRVVIDATNPVGPGLTHGLRSERAGASHLASLVPEARVVKAFNVYGFENLVDPPSGPDGVHPLMPIAGDDAAATEVVASLAAQMGWEPLVVGPLAAAVDLEHLTLLWVRLVRALGHPPRLVWAALRDVPDGDQP